MVTFQIVLMIFLIACAVAVSFTKNLLNSVLIFMSFSLIMSMIWMCLESPDLAITEAAVGAGVTTLLFFACLKRIEAIAVDKAAETSSEDKAAEETEQEDGNE